MSKMKVNRIENTSTASGGLDVDTSGKVRITTLADSAGNNDSTPAEIASGRAKAWVNFNGTGTVAIRSSFNVASVTDNGTGNYTITFTNAMADTSYTPVFGCQADQIGTTSNGNVYGEIARYSNALGTASARTAWGVGGYSYKYDPTIATVAIFR